MHMEVRALFDRFVWHVVNIDTSQIHPSHLHSKNVIETT